MQAGLDQIKEAKDCSAGNAISPDLTMSLTIALRTSIAKMLLALLTLAFLPTLAQSLQNTDFQEITALELPCQSN